MITKNKKQKLKREKLPAPVVAINIVTAAVILAICAAVFFFMFNKVKGEPGAGTPVSSGVQNAE